MRDYFDRLAALREALRLEHEGACHRPTLHFPVHASLHGYAQLGPAELGWTQRQVHAYLAGLMDSDGSFRTEKRAVRGMRSPHYRINIRCAQVAPSPAIELLAKTFGGSMGIRHEKRPNSRDLATWSLHDKAAVPAIRSILPFLVVKQTEAWLLLELRGLKERGKGGLTEWVHANRWHDQVQMRKRCYTTDQVASFERIHRAIQELHSGGIAKTSSLPKFNPDTVDDNLAPLQSQTQQRV
jgi:hypothetical protein